MDTKDLRCFCLVYEARSMNKAAGQLFITPQGLSKVIDRLEAELQVPLFTRSKGGTVPTEYGDYFYRRSQSLLFQLEDIKLKMRAFGDSKKTYHVGFASGVLNVLPLQMLDGIKARHPNANFIWEEMGNDELGRRLQDHSLDLGFIVGRNSFPNLWSQGIYSVRMNAVIYPGHSYYDREYLSVQDLRGERIITLNQKYSIYNSLIQRCNDFGFTPDIVMATMESALIYKFCHAREGIGVDADIHADTALYPELRRVELRDAIPWTVSLVCHESEKDNPAIAEVLEMCQA